MPFPLACRSFLLQSPGSLKSVVRLGEGVSRVALVFLRINAEVPITFASKFLFEGSSSLAKCQFTLPKNCLEEKRPADNIYRGYLGLSTFISSVVIPYEV